MKHLISSRTALCLCGLTLCFNASAQGYVSYNHDAAKMNQITVQEIGSGGLTLTYTNKPSIQTEVTLNIDNNSVTSTTYPIEGRWSPY